MEAIYNALAVGEDETTDNGFLKNAFHYQLHDRIQWGNMLCIVLAGVFTWFLRAQYFLDLRLCVICLMAVSAAFLAGFSFLHNTKLFRAVGYCWRDGDTVVIECGEREYRIASVKELIGGDTRFFFARSGIFLKYFPYRCIRKNHLNNLPFTLSVSSFCGAFRICKPWNYPVRKPNITM